MARRITSERVKTYLATGSTGALAIIGVIALILNLGVATVDSYDANVYCGGDEVCWLVLNNTCFKEDVFVYPMDDPAAIINGDPSNLINDAKMYRSWGDGWREFDMAQTCTGTWCGAPDNKGVSYVVAFRKDRCYNLRFEVWKPEEAVVSWKINPEGEWLELEAKPLNLMMIKKFCDVETKNYTVKCDAKNLSCSEKDEGVFYYNVTSNCREILITNNQSIDFRSQGWNCHVEKGVAECDTYVDGNGDGYCQAEGGETCIRIENDLSIGMKNSEKEFARKDGRLVDTKGSLLVQKYLVPKLFVDDKEVYKEVVDKETVDYLKTIDDDSLKVMTK